MTDTDHLNLVQLKDEDLDNPIYRIYSLFYLENIFLHKEDALVNPRKWEDPFENFFLQATKARDPDTGSLIDLSNLAEDWYGQCWSLHKETDAMWRIYSPEPKKLPGVKVCTTIRKIFENLKAVGSAAPFLQFFIGKVDYLNEQKIHEQMAMANLTNATMDGRGASFAKALCIKRTEFDHEAEVRLLFQDINPKRGTNGVFKFDLDANKIFTELVLDPRLSKSHVEALKKRLWTLGCKLPIEQSSLYQVPEFVIEII